jgi:hypothetical protein
MANNVAKKPTGASGVRPKMDDDKNSYAMRGNRTLTNK